MSGIQTNKAPAPGLVIAHYVCATLFFLALCGLLVFSSDALSGHYFHPKLLAITHMAALGWGTMLIFGTLYQLLPVILDTSLYSEKIAWITFITFTLGVILLVYSFWHFYVGIHLQIAASLLLIAFLLFLANILLTMDKVNQKMIESAFVLLASIWLLYTGILGALMAFNFTYMFLPKSHLLYLKIHGHMGIIGWFVLLIMGIGSKLIPMFLLSHNLNRKKLTVAIYSINIGLIGFSIDLFFREDSAFLPPYAILIVSGLLSFISYVYEAFKKRIRKTIDVGLKHSALAFLFLLIPIIIGLILSFLTSLNNKFMLQVYLVYGVAIFLGFITSLILGQTFKILPFIVWLREYGKLKGKEKKLLPKDLYSSPILTSQFVVYILAMPTLILGILLTQPIIMKVGALLLLATATLYTINIFKIVLHKSNVIP